METQNLNTKALMTNYMNIVNRAIQENHDKFPFDKLISVGKDLTRDKKIGAAVYKSDAKQPHDYFTITHTGDRFKAEQGKQAPDIEWKIKEEHLQNVVQNPNEYIQNPLKLDLDWIKTRLS